MLGFAVERQSETIRQKLLKHMLPLKQALIFTKLLQRIKQPTRCFTNMKGI
jgi:hypothetical protein